jgi:hypothetical protein
MIATEKSASLLRKERERAAALYLNAWVLQIVSSLRGKFASPRFDDIIFQAFQEAKAMNHSFPTLYRLTSFQLQTLKREALRVARARFAGTFEQAEMYETKAVRDATEQLNIAVQTRHGNKILLFL